MAATEVRPARGGTLAQARKRGRLRFGEDYLLGYLLVSPVLLYILVLVGYPFFLSLYFSVSNVTVASGYNGFAGADNFISLFGDPVFQKALSNSLSFTLISEIAKAVLGIGLAFLLLQKLPGKKVIRGFLMLPWTLPITLSLFGWRWMFDPQFSVINYSLSHLGLIHHPYPSWLGDASWAYGAILMVNIWRGFPFSAVIILAGLTSIPSDIYDAAKVDGAGFFRTWHYVITPMIAPILFIGLIFDVTFTLGDLTIVFLLTNGGPGFSTEILPTVAFHTGILGGDLSHGAAAALVLFPFLLVSMVVFLRILYRRQAQ